MPPAFWAFFKRQGEEKKTEEEAEESDWKTQAKKKKSTRPKSTNGPSVLATFASFESRRLRLGSKTIVKNHGF